jgi:hypothetical protein
MIWQHDRCTACAASSTGRCPCPHSSRDIGHLQASFDRTFYVERYPDMALGVVDPLEHYALFGWKEGRDPSEWFSTRHYLADNADVARTGINPLLHYVLYGQHEDRRIRTTTAASGALTDLPQPNGQPMELGNAEICDRLRGAFDAGFYRDRYPDIARSLIDQLRSAARCHATQRHALGTRECRIPRGT